MRKKPSVNGASKSDSVRSAWAKKPKATAKEIQETLRGDGVTVSLALVSKLKHGKPKAGKGAKRRGGRQPGNGPSKADAIREAFASLGPKARNRDVMELLAKRGIKVQPAQVSNLRKAKARGRRVAAASVGSPLVFSVSVDHLRAAKQMIAQVGGIEIARQALDSLAELVEA